ncbi:MAG: DUF2065 domain-containing protein [Desulfuromonadales bacterium]|nr:DUF2065 domain-containing protein [Desulfuromonadales bacterium]
MNLEFLFTVIGVVLIIEGLPWFLSPRGAKRTMAQLFLLGDQTMRGVGLCLMLGGLFVVYLAINY